MTGRAAAPALGKLTWLIAIAFIGTSIALTVVAARNSAGSSVLDRLGVETETSSDFVAPIPEEGEALLPPSPEDEPLAPARADE